MPTRYTFVLTKVTGLHASLLEGSDGCSRRATEKKSLLVPEDSATHKRARQRDKEQKGLIWHPPCMMSWRVPSIWAST